MDKQSSKIETLKKNVNRTLGWGIMGTVLIIVFTLAVVAACVAAANKEGVTSMIIIGSLAEAILLCGCIINYCKQKSAAAHPIVHEPASIDEEAPVVAEAKTEEAPAAVEEVVAEEPVVAEEVADAPVAEITTDEVAAEEAPVDEEAAEEAVEEPEIEPEPVAEEAVFAEPEVEEEPAVVIGVDEARDSMSDDEALALIEVRAKAKVDGPMCTVNVGVLSATFDKDEVVTLAALQAKGLVPRKQNGYIVLAKGTINKPLTVVANDFSADAVKMIVAAGGKAIGC